MRAPGAVFVLCCLPQACPGLRAARGVPGLAEPPPGERHIQYLGQPSWGSGIGDRVALLTWLVNLGIFHNATVHMKGGPKGARDYLATNHSMTVNSSGYHYLDIEGGCGKDPFREVEPFEPCWNVYDTNVDFGHDLFAHGRRCVNLMHRFYDYPKAKKFPIRPEQECQIYGRGLNPKVYEYADQFVREQGLPRHHYGTFHARRCDRLGTNWVCTQPHVMLNTILGISKVRDWVIFIYAEPGYIKRVKQEMENRCVSCHNRTIILEDEVQIRPNQHDGDNYLTQLVNVVVQSRAAVNVQSQYCRHGVGTIQEKKAKGKRKTSLVRGEARGEQETGLEWAFDDLHLGLCGGAGGAQSMMASPPTD